jgi:putative MATE family efflux protein
MTSETNGTGTRPNMQRRRTLNGTDGMKIGASSRRGEIGWAHKDLGAVRIAWPASVEFLISTLIIFADTLFLARLGTEVLAGMGLSVTLFRIFYEAFLGIAVASTTVIAQAVGAGDRGLAERGAAHSISLAVLAGIAAGGVGAWVAPVGMDLMGASGVVKEAGVTYMRINLLAAPLYAAALTGGGVLKGVGDTRTPMIFTLIASALKIGLNMVLIYGRWGLPAMGVAGAALATLVAYGLNTVLIMAKLGTGFDGLRVGLGAFRLDTGLLKRIVALSAPVAVERVVMRIGFVLYVRMISALGTVALAANTVAVRLEDIFINMGFGFTVAATTLVGQAVGRGDLERAKEKAYESLRFAFLTMASLTVILILIRNLAVGMFGPEEDVRSLAVTCVAIGAFELPALGVLFTFAGASRGAGDTVSPMLVSAIGTFALRLPLVYLLGLHFGLGLKGIWYGTLIDWIGRATLMWLIFRSGEWKGKAFIKEAEKTET